MSRTSSTGSSQSDTSKNSRHLQIIYIVVALGMTIYALRVYLYSHTAGQTESSPNQVQGIRALSYVTAFITLGACFGANIVYKSLFKKLTASGNEMASAKVISNETIFRSIRVATIIRLVMFAFPAFLGLQTCSIAIHFGLLPAQPIYWLAAIPYFVLLLFVAITFPTPKSIARLITEKTGL